MGDYGGDYGDSLLNAPSSGLSSWTALAYTYDPDDNIGAIVDLVDDSRSAYYGYDGNDRMTFASIAVGTPANDTAIRVTVY